VWMAAHFRIQVPLCYGYPELLRVHVEGFVRWCVHLRASNRNERTDKLYKTDKTPLFSCQAWSRYALDCSGRLGLRSQRAFVKHHTGQVVRAEFNVVIYCAAALQTLAAHTILIYTSRSLSTFF
jgi:hypothetical protein